MSGDAVIRLKKAAPLSLPRGEILRTESCAYVMGILNITEDSFWRGSRYPDPEFAAERALQMRADGADIIDVGGESTRPGSQYIGEEEELRRVTPVIKAIRRRSSVPISVDTRKIAVMRAAFDCGADIVNDISALNDSPGAADFAARAGTPVILMHKKGDPKSMQLNPCYDNVTEEVFSWLADAARKAEARGIARDKIILDPGIGFGKTFEDNRRLISEIGKLAALGYPVLMAASRKTFVGEASGGAPVDRRLAGTIAVDLYSVAMGVSYVRVHDVAEARASLDTLEFLSGYRAEKKRED